MSGSSSAFLYGHLADRDRALIRKKDLDLSEILDLCSKPTSIDERVAEVQRYSSVYPQLKLFLLVAYFYKGAFSELMKNGPIDYIPSRTPKGGSPETLASMWNQVTRLYNEFALGPKAKRGVAQQLLGSLHKDDAELIHQLIQGKFYSKELNEAVVAKAFPQDAPKDPKP